MDYKIVEKIAKDFRVNTQVSSKIRTLRKKMFNGVATYKDANTYAIETAKALGKALRSNLGTDALSAAEYKEIVGEVIPDSLRSIHNTISEYTKAVQQGINENAKIGLKAVVPDINAENVAAITRKAASVSAYSEVAGTIDQETMNFAQTVGTKMMKENAKFQEDVGLYVYIERIYDDVGLRADTKYAEPCDWCLEREGYWSYGDAYANGAFERHPGCSCTIIFHTGKGASVQTDWKHNKWD